MSLSENLKEARQRKRITQEELANILGKSKNVISNWERGDNKPDADTLFTLCDILGVDANFLLGWSENKEFALSIKEQDRIKKYRALESHGKEMVDMVLDKEYKYMQEQSLKDQPLETEHATLIHENRLYMTEYDRCASAGTGNYLDEWDIPKNTISVPDTPETRKADFVIRVMGDSMEPNYHDGDRVLVKSQDSVNIDDIAIYIIDGESYIKQYKGNYLHSLNPAYDDIQMDDNQTIKCVGKVIGNL